MNRRSALNPLAPWPRLGGLPRPRCAKMGSSKFCSYAATLLVMILLMLVPSTGAAEAAAPAPSEGVQWRSDSALPLSFDDDSRKYRNTENYEVEEEEEEEALPPTFDSDEGQKSFLEGQEQFQLRAWRDATRSFAAARKASADTRSKKLVQAWEKACKGGKALDRADKDHQKGAYRKAWSGVAALQKKYGMTPLSTAIDVLKQKVYSELFLDLATFEETPVEVEEAARKALPKDRSRIILDPERIFEGKGALEWRSGGGQGFAGLSFGRLPIATIEDVVMEDYRWIRFSVFNEDDNFGKFSLFFGTEPIGPNQAQAGGVMALLQRNCYYHHFTVKKPGWNHFRIDLTKDLSMSEAIEWSDLLSLYLLTVPPSHPKKITIDAVKLEKQ
ncbi:MAG: hypothetical protein OSB09_02190 [Planctomycetota bacterium]|nr:hypothetical protein [Planctomycetota bacterium]